MTALSPYNDPRIANPNQANLPRPTAFKPRRVVADTGQLVDDTDDAETAITGVVNPPVAGMPVRRRTFAQSMPR